MNAYHYVSGNLLQATDPIGLGPDGQAEFQQDQALAERQREQRFQQATEESFTPVEAPQFARARNARTGGRMNVVQEATASGMAWAVAGTWNGDEMAYSLWHRGGNGHPSEWTEFDPRRFDMGTVASTDEVAATLIETVGTAGFALVYRVGTRVVARVGLRALERTVERSVLRETARMADNAASGAGPSFTSELEIGANAARRHLRRAVTGSGGEVHHLVPWQTRAHELVQRAARGGFNINGAENGVRLSTNLHRGSHPTFNARVGAHLDRILEANPNISPAGAAEALRSLAAGARQGILRRGARLD